MPEQEWAGNKARQAFLVKLMLDLLDLEEESPIDIAGAVGTIVANIICDNSKDKADALDGFKAWCGDMEHTIGERFSQRGTGST